MTRPSQGEFTAFPAQASRAKAVRMVAMAAAWGFGKLECHLAAFDLVQGSEQPAVPPIRQQRFEQKAIDRLAGNRDGDQGQLRNDLADIGRSGRRQPHHIQHQSGTIVGACVGERGRNQGPRGIVGRGAGAQHAGDVLVGQEAMKAVAAQQKAIVQGHRLGDVIAAGLPLPPPGRGTGIAAGPDRPCGHDPR